jgi:hypothetical protein
LRPIVACFQLRAYFRPVVSQVVWQFMDWRQVSAQPCAASSSRTILRTRS